MNSSKLHEDDDSMRNNSTAKQSETTFSYDEVLEHIGQLGRYQLCTFLVLLLPCFFFGLTILSYTFVGGMPQYRLVCFIILTFYSKSFGFFYNSLIHELKKICEFLHVWYYKIRYSFDSRKKWWFASLT